MQAYLLIARLHLISQAVLVSHCRRRSAALNSFRLWHSCNFSTFIGFFCDQKRAQVIRWLAINSLLGYIDLVKTMFKSSVFLTRGIVLGIKTWLFFCKSFRHF